MHGTIGSTTNDTSILEVLDFSERSEDPCEHSQHGSDHPILKQHHYGPGKWLIRNEPCEECGEGGNALLVCDPFYRTLLRCRAVRCKSCHAPYPVSSYTLLGQKGVDF